MFDKQAQAVRRHDSEINWFTEKLRRKMLACIEQWETPEFCSLTQKSSELDRVTEAKTVGELLDILYYDWSHHNDISLISMTFTEACELPD